MELSGVEWVGFVEVIGVCGCEVVLDVLWCVVFGFVVLY